MNARIFLILTIAYALNFSVVAAEKNPAPTAKEAFEKMKALAGEWRGHVGGRDQGPEATVIYKVISAGSAVEETLFPGTPHEMVTMYHLDGDKLVLTHYCAMGNQPKMALTKKSTANILDFDFTGGTNIKSKNASHMHAARIRLESPNKISAEWDSYDGGKKVDTKKFFLTRKS